MDRIKVVMREIGPIAFQTGLFSPLAEDTDILAPVAIYPEHAGIDKYDVDDLPQGFQTLRAACELPKHAIQVWATYAAFAGVAQYSARHACITGVLGRHDVHFRNAVREEIQHDLKWFGEQVAAGPKISELPEDKRDVPYVEFLGERFVYTGPSRLVKTVVVSRVFSGALEDRLEGFVREVDGISEEGDKIVKQEYHLFIADNGQIRYTAFREPDGFNPEKLKDYGKVVFKGDRMLREFPGQDPVDQSELLVCPRHL